MKKWIAAAIILAVLLAASMGLNAFQLICSHQNNAEFSAPLNADYSKIEWGKYFVLQLSKPDSLDYNPFEGEVFGYDLNGNVVFEAEFSPNESPWMSYDGKFGIDIDRLYIKLTFIPTKVSKIIIGDVEINTPSGFKIYSRKVYDIALTNEVSSEGRIIGTIK